MSQKLNNHEIREVSNYESVCFPSETGSILHISISYLIQRYLKILFINLRIKTVLIVNLFVTKYRVCFNKFTKQSDRVHPVS